MPFDATPQTERQARFKKVAEALEARWTDPRANVEKLARMLEESESFDIGCLYNDCGTPACIWGHAMVLFKVDTGMANFANTLGVPERKLSLLCCGWDFNEVGGLDRNKITGPMAAAALRRLADTGEAYFSLDDA